MIVIVVKSFEIIEKKNKFFIKQWRITLPPLRITLFVILILGKCIGCAPVSNYFTLLPCVKILNCIGFNVFIFIIYIFLTKQATVNYSTFVDAVHTSTVHYSTSYFCFCVYLQSAPVLTVYLLYPWIWSMYMYITHARIHNSAMLVYFLTCNLFPTVYPYWSWIWSTYVCTLRKHIF